MVLKKFTKRLFNWNTEGEKEMKCNNCGQDYQGNFAQTAEPQRQGM